MNPKLTVLANENGGVFSRSEALASGYTDSQLRERTRRGEWIMLRRGYYAAAPRSDDLPPWESDDLRHRLEIRAAVRALQRSPVVVSHHSAVLLHGIPTWGADHSKVQVTRRDTITGRVRAGIRYHVGRVHNDAVTAVDGIAVTRVARALVELACVSSYETAVIAMDAALHRGAVTPDALREALLTVAAWPGSGTAKAAVDFADGKAESVGESRLRVLMDNHGLPTPVLQACYVRGDKVEIRVDFLLRDLGVIIEFDGLVKYRDSAAEVVLAEKRREDRLRELGLIVVRVTWDELATPEVVVQRIRRAIALAENARRGA